MRFLENLGGARRRECSAVLVQPLSILAVAIGASACGPSAIRVNGVIRDSTEMRPLRNLPQGAYHELRVFVRAGSEGTEECGTTPLEGSEDHNNAACVPADATNSAVRLVRQRLRSYGVDVARDGSEPADYEVSVVVVGVAPKKPDPMGAKAVARLTFALHGEGDGFFRGVDAKAASLAFDTVAKDCALQDAELSTFAASSSQPMTPDFDITVLASDAVDNAVGCDELARFFLDAKKRFPAPAAPASSVAPSPSAAPAASPSAPTTPPTPPH
jgi:hypothetical protein